MVTGVVGADRPRSMAGMPSWSSSCTGAPMVKTPAGSGSITGQSRQSRISRGSRGWASAGIANASTIIRAENTESFIDAEARRFADRLEFVRPYRALIRA